MTSLLHPQKQTPTLKNNVLLEERKEIPEIKRYIENVLPQLTSLKYFIEEELDTDEAFEILDEDLPDGMSRSDKKFFIKDIVRLCTLFFKQTRSKNIRLQLEIVKTDMCRFFHVDNYRQRLLCTYIGPGTEWLDPANVRKEGLGKGCNHGIVKDFNAIRRAKEFDVLLIKGAKHEGKDAGIVHRSPPIVKDAKTRVLLKIDEWN